MAILERHTPKATRENTSLPGMPRVNGSASPPQGHEMFGELEYLNYMTEVFTTDAAVQYPELNRRLPPIDRLSKKQKGKLIAGHVAGLLHARTVAQQTDSSDSDSSVPRFYRERYRALKEQLEEKRDEITANAGKNGGASDDLRRLRSTLRTREILKANYNAKKFPEVGSLVEQTGLSPEMVKGAKKDRRFNYLKSSAWTLAENGFDIGAGWGVAELNHLTFDVNNLPFTLTMGAIALGTRGFSTFLTWRKSKIVEPWFKKYGYGPDPATQFAADIGKAQEVNLVANGVMEGGFLASTVGSIKALGLSSAAIAEPPADGYCVTG